MMKNVLQNKVWVSQVSGEDAVMKESVDGPQRKQYRGGELQR